MGICRALQERRSLHPVRRLAQALPDGNEKLPERGEQRREWRMSKCIWLRFVRTYTRSTQLHAHGAPTGPRGGQRLVNECPAGPGLRGWLRQRAPKRNGWAGRLVSAIIQLPSFSSCRNDHAS
jgi:hypothetical protein